MLFNCGVGEDSWESHWMQRNPPVHPKGNPSWIFIGRTDIEAETPILRPPDAKEWLIGKDPDAGKDWGQEEKGMTEDRWLGWHHWLDGHEFEQALGAGDGQGSLACCSPRGHKESDILSDWTELILGGLHLLFFLWNFRSKPEISGLPLEQEFYGLKSEFEGDYELGEEKNMPFSSVQMPLIYLILIALQLWM